MIKIHGVGRTTAESCGTNDKTCLIYFTNDDSLVSSYTGNTAPVVPKNAYNMKVEFTPLQEVYKKH